MKKRPWGSVSFVALLLLAGSRVLPDSQATDLLQYGALSACMLAFAGNIYAGYRHRRPHWTAQSWRRFLAASALPVGALLLVFAMALAVDYRFPLAGAGRSTTRAIWVGTMVLFLVTGGIGFSVVLGWLLDGDPKRQLGWSPRRFWSASWTQ